MAKHILPVKKIVFYKHGVCFFERQGKISGEKALKLAFKKKDMNDILKSLIVLDRDPAGKVVSLSYDTQEDVEQIIREKSINLSKWNRFVDLLSSLTGYEVTVHLKGEKITGTVVGVNYNPENKDISQNLFSLYIPGLKKVRTCPLTDIKDIDLNDETANKELAYFLEKSIAERKKDERFVTVILDGESHDLLISYIASAPVWKVSYRLIYTGKDNKCLLMGWGIINNTLEEDLEDIEIVLTTGLPISFIYDLYTPGLLARPEVKDSGRAPAAPVVLEKNMEDEIRELGLREYDKKYGVTSPGGDFDDDIAVDYCKFVPDRPPAAKKYDYSKVSEKTRLSTMGEKEGQFFKYNISEPVTIKRGQSAMVPVLNANFDCFREHVYTSKTGKRNPYITLCFKNNSHYILERGPVTIVEDGSYVGEAVVPFISKEQEVRLPYAVDVEVSVKEDLKVYDIFNSFVFKIKDSRPDNQSFFQEVYTVSETLYTASNSSDTDITLIIEHILTAGFEIFDTSEPLEKTENFFRWKISVPSRSSQTLTVKERKKIYRGEAYRTLSMKNLSEWLQKRYLDEETYNSLKGIFHLFEEIKNIEESIARLEKEHKMIRATQKSNREQIQALGDRTEGESLLRSRYVKNMEEQENRMEEINVEISELDKQITGLKKKTEEAIEELSKSYKS